MTFEQLILNNLPDEIALEAIEEIVKQDKKEDMLIDADVLLEKYALSATFIWEDSKKGYKYWSKIEKKYFNV